MSATRAPAFSTRPVTPANWTDLEALFEGKGGPKPCWCVAFRPMEQRATADGPARKRAQHDRVRAGVPIGLLAYLDEDPVAWCSVAPRESFLRLSSDQNDAEGGVWSVTCFFVRRDHRKTGLSARLLDAAIELARSRGGKVLEAYPVARDSPSYRFMGFDELFEKRGFSLTGRTGSRRHVMRLAL